DKICSTFSTVLTGVFHERIEYPEIAIPPREPVIEKVEDVEEEVEEASDTEVQTEETAEIPAETEAPVEEEESAH
ncbi:MAG: hypothetical protein J6M10_01095, partial [Clostridia bacterium]|nr:hypothetical protein [Clostridia bacterium]